MTLILVGDDTKCSVIDVVVTIRTSSPNINAAKLDSLMALLRTDLTLREHIKRNLELKIDLLPESLERVLEEWRSRVKTVASLDALIYVLKHCDLSCSAEALRNKFYIQANMTSQNTSLCKTTSSFSNQADDNVDLEKNGLINDKNQVCNNDGNRNLNFLKKHLPFGNKSTLKKIRQTLQIVSVILFVIFVVLGLNTWYKYKVNID